MIKDLPERLAESLDEDADEIRRQAEEIEIAPPWRGRVEESQ